MSRLLRREAATILQIPSLQAEPQQKVERRVPVKKTVSQRLRTEDAIREPCFITKDTRFAPETMTEKYCYWMTVAGCKAYFENTTFHAKIQVTAKGTFTAKNCVFYTTDSESQEIGIEIFAKSNAFFENCSFIGGKTYIAALKSNSNAVFKECKFSENANGLIVMENSTAEISDSLFEKVAGICIYTYKNAKSSVRKCTFKDGRGKANFVFSSSSEISDCRAEKMAGSFLFCQQSEVEVSNCVCENVREFASVSLKSKATIKDCSAKTVAGNFVYVNNSTASLSGCTADHVINPAIAVKGNNSSATVNKCTIKNCDGAAVAVREFASPMFTDVTIENVASDAFSVSDWSKVVVKNCTISRVSKTTFCAFNGGELHIANNKLEECVDKFRTFLEGSIVHEEVHEHLPVVIDNEAHKCHCHDCHKCVHCGGEAHKVCNPCGHRICDECTGKGFKSCPLCNTSCLSIIPVFEQEVCCICLDAAPSMIVMPCGHKCLCAECCAALVENSQKCPFCTGKLTAAKTDF